MYMQNVDQIFTCFIILIIGSWTSLPVDTVRIRELRVPAVVRHGAAVVLDCDYTFDGPKDHEGLVVKWYLNDQSRPVYQWIPGGAGGPQGLGLLRDRLNLTYRASEDAKTEHRALHIAAPAPDIAGDYTCVVSTFLGEDRQTKSMLVFVPEKNLHLRQTKTLEGVPAVVCSAEGVYPEPEMAIRMAHENTSREIDGTPILSSGGDNDLYDITMVASLSADILDPESLVPSVFTCELRVPRANYTVKREFVYYPGNTASSILSCAWILLPTLITSILLYF